MMRIADCTLARLIESAVDLKIHLSEVDYESAALGHHTETDLLANWARASVFQLVGEDPIDGPDDGRALIATDPAGGSNRFS
ncbi:MAG: hypothetical protein GWQ05_13185 [Verrucomicrobiaceae bacterium]|nr:hypothetical protein [Verrucomicrobiaceae bacterium]